MRSFGEQTEWEKVVSGVEEFSIKAGFEILFEHFRWIDEELRLREDMKLSENILFAVMMNCLGIISVTSILL